MSMFSNYLDTNYIPNNIKPNEPDIYISEPIELPYKMYDIKLYISIYKAKRTTLRKDVKRKIG